MKTRTGKQIRDRFLNSLDERVIKRKFNNDEDEEILNLYKKYGNCWSLIAKNLKGRTGDMVKNRFYSKLIKFKDSKNNIIKIKEEKDNQVVNDCHELFNNINKENNNHNNNMNLDYNDNYINEIKKLKTENCILKNEINWLFNYIQCNIPFNYSFYDNQQFCFNKNI